MSDFFIGEMLILGLLLVPILRPFSNSLKECKTIPTLDFLALFICFLAVLGYGARISFLPVMLITFICIITETPRFVKSVRSLPNDEYGIFAVTVRCVLAVFIFVIAGFAVVSEINLPPQKKFKHVKGKELSASNKALPVNGLSYKKALPLIKEEKEKSEEHGMEIEAEEIKKSVTQNKWDAPPLIIVLNHVRKSIPEPNMITVYFAERDFDVIQLFSLEKTFGFIPSFDEFFCITKALLSGTYPMPEKINADKKAFKHLNGIMEAYGKNRPVFAFAEGASTDVLTQFAFENEDLTGAFILLSEEEPRNIQTKNENVFELESKSTKDFEQTSSEKKLLVFLQPPQMLPGMADIRCTDMISSVLCKSYADKKGAERFKTASVFEKWIFERMEFLKKRDSEKKSADFTGEKAN